MEEPIVETVKNVEFPKVEVKAYGEVRDKNGNIKTGSLK